MSPLAANAGTCCASLTDVQLEVHVQFNYLHLLTTTPIRHVL